MAKSTKSLTNWRRYKERKTIKKGKDEKVWKVNKNIRIGRGTYKEREKENWSQRKRKEIVKEIVKRIKNIKEATKIKGAESIKGVKNIGWEKRIFSLRQVLNLSWKLLCAYIN